MDTTVWIKVHNLNGTGDNKAKDAEDWLDFWRKKTNRKTGFCAVKNCGNSANVGAHVKIADETNKQYIVPFCSFHNNQPSSKDMYVKKSDLVPVNDD